MSCGKRRRRRRLRDVHASLSGMRVRHITRGGGCQSRRSRTLRR